MEHYGAIRSFMETEGKTIGPLDTLIAAHALSLSLTVISTNTREFSRVPDLECEDWT